MTTPRDAIGLSDRLREWASSTKYGADNPLIEEAATALDALSAENEHMADTIIKLNEYLTDANARTEQAEARVEELEKAIAHEWFIEQCGEIGYVGIRDYSAMESRATSAEQERDEALERLKPFAAYTVKAIMLSEQFDYCVHVCCSADEQPQFKHFSAARDLVRRLAAGTEKENPHASD